MPDDLLGERDLDLAGRLQSGLDPVRLLRDVGRKPVVHPLAAVRERQHSDTNHGTSLLN